MGYIVCLVATVYREKRGTICMKRVSVPLQKCASDWRNLQFEEILPNSNFGFVTGFHRAGCVDSMYKKAYLM